MDKYAKGRFDAVHASLRSPACPRCGGNGTPQTDISGEEEPYAYQCMECDSKWRDLPPPLANAEQWPKQVMFDSLGTIDPAAEMDNALGGRVPPIHSVNPHSGGARPFGRRYNLGAGGQNGTGSRPDAVTRDFFDRPPGGDPYDDLYRDEDEFPLHVIKGLQSTRSLAYAAIPLALAAILVPQIALRFQGDIGLPSGVDPMTTASVSRQQNLPKISDIKLMHLVRGTEKVLSVTGRVANNTTEPLLPMVINISIRGGDGAEVQSWKYTTGSKTIPAGSNLKFTTSALDLSGKAESVSVNIVGAN